MDRAFVLNHGISSRRYKDAYDRLRQSRRSEPTFGEKQMRLTTENKSSMAIFSGPPAPERAFADDVVTVKQDYIPDPGECHAVAGHCTFQILEKSLQYSFVLVTIFSLRICSLFEWLIDRLIDWLIDWLVDWLIDCLFHWSIDWLIDWLLALLANSSLSLDWWFSFRRHRQLETKAGTYWQQRPNSQPVHGGHNFTQHLSASGIYWTSDGHFERSPRHEGNDVLRKHISRRHGIQCVFPCHLRILLPEEVGGSVIFLYKKLSSSPPPSLSWHVTRSWRD